MRETRRRVYTYADRIDRRHRAPSGGMRRPSQRVMSSSGSSDLSVHYGSHLALGGRRSRHLQEPGHGDDRAVRLREEHLHPLPEPDERPRPGREGRRAGALPRRGHLRRGRRPGRGAPADRDGLPAAEPVPEVDLRQRRLRAEEARPPRATWTSASSEALRRCRALGRGQGPAEAERARALRRTAAAPLHRPRARRRARGDPARRAGLGARPDLDRRDRGPDARAQARLHARDRHPQHAAGRPRRRHDRLLQPRDRRTATGTASSSSTTRRRRSSLTRPTSEPRTTSPGASDEGRVPPRSSNVSRRGSNSRATWSCARSGSP